MGDDGSDELIRFEAGDFDPRSFTHREHVRLAFEMLQRHCFTEAANRFACGLKTIVRRAGRPEGYNETITVAFLALIAERTASAEYRDFPAFERANPDLLDRGLLKRWYPDGRLQSDIARKTFVLPEPVGRFDARGEGQRGCENDRSDFLARRPSIGG
jgi:hypothetical protein